MTPEMWTIVGTGFVILGAIAVAVSRLDRRLDRVEDRLDKFQAKTADEFAALRKEMAEQNSGLADRVSRVEGALNVVRDLLTGRHAA